MAAIEVPVSLRHRVQLVLDIQSWILLNQDCLLVSLRLKIPLLSIRAPELDLLPVARQIAIIGPVSPLVTLHGYLVLISSLSVVHVKTAQAARRLWLVANIIDPWHLA